MGFLSQILSHSFGGWKTRARFISYHWASLEALLVLCLHGWCHLGLAASWSTISHADNLKSLYQYFYGLLNPVGVCDSMVEPSRMRIPPSLSLPVFSNVTRQNLWQKSEGSLICKAAHPPDPSFVDNKPVSYTPQLRYHECVPLASCSPCQCFHRRRRSHCACSLSSWSSAWNTGPMYEQAVRQLWKSPQSSQFGHTRGNSLCWLISLS